ncbi:MAG: Holliday junction DNA helicase RuvB C-terminal domain-containing protein [Holdemania massiliensis]
MDTPYRYLRALSNVSPRRTGRSEALASSISEEPMTLEDVYGAVFDSNRVYQSTSRGRAATPKAYEHLKIAYHDQLFDL